MDRTQASGYVINTAGKRVYADKVPGQVQGTSLIAVDRTATQEEIVGAIEASGQTPDNNNLAQLQTAIAVLGNLPVWSLAFAKTIGGYPARFVVQDASSSGIFWVSTADNNLTTPGAANAAWRSLFTGYITQTASDARYILKAGDTSGGNQANSALFTSGSLMWGPNWSSSIKGQSGGQSAGDYAFAMFAQQLSGSYTAGILSLNGFQGHRDWRFNEDGHIYGPLGRLALLSDIPGTFAVSGNNWFWMKLPNGILIQGGNASYNASDGTNGTTVTLPTSFGASFIYAGGNDVGSNANSVTVMRINGSTIRLLGREVTSGTLQNTTMNYLCIGTAP